MAISCTLCLTDLVRDVMVMRADDEETGFDGGTEGLQREVIQLFLAAYEELDTGSKGGSDAALTKDFIVRSLRHHVLNAHNSEVQLWDDELLMRVLTHDSNVICARAVSGIGSEELKVAIHECESAGVWWKAAQLWYAASTPRGQRAGEELKRALQGLTIECVLLL